MPANNHLTIEEILNDLRGGCACERNSYCPSSVLLRNFSPRIIEQHKCIEVFKWIESGKQRREIGWEEAYSLWAERDYAKKFAEIYADGMKHKELFERTTGIKLESGTK
jgi:hypothetical protein